MIVHLRSDMLCNPGVMRGTAGKKEAGSRVAQLPAFVPMENHTIEWMMAEIACSVSC